MENINLNEQNSFASLAAHIKQANDVFRQSASSAINKHVTARNWLTGFYIVHYEQGGCDRAKYGSLLLQKLADKLNTPGLSSRDLRLYRNFYLNFIVLAKPIEKFILSYQSNWQSPIANLKERHFLTDMIWQSVIAKSDSKESDDIQISADKLFSNLSFTHFVQLLPISDPLERTFYELETIKGCWSARELKRQINSGYYVRSGLSRDKKALRQLVNQNASLSNMAETIKSPFVFEFLGLDGKDVVEESDLESALMDHLQQFLLELGTGFCFEARQKRILVDNQYYYCDLIFYNRLIHSGVIVELKSHPLDYKDVAQLNMYLAYYRKNMMAEGDNPPVGILMCTGAGEEMVEYATAGIDENMFISKYKLKLPSKEELTKWLKDQVEELEP